MVTVTRLLDYLKNIWPIPTLKFAQWHLKYAQVSSKFYQKLIPLFQNGTSFLMFCQSVEISPNLVTLIVVLNQSDQSAWVKSRSMFVKSCPKILSQEKCKISIPFQKLPKFVVNLGLKVVDTSFKKNPKATINRPIWSHCA